MGYVQYTEEVLQKSFHKKLELLKQLDYYCSIYEQNNREKFKRRLK